MFLFCFFDSLFGNNIIRMWGQFWMMNPLENALSVFFVVVDLFGSHQFWALMTQTRQTLLLAATPNLRCEDG